MGVTAAIIAGGASLIGTGISVLGRGSPQYPSPPTFYKLPVQKAKNFMESYEQRRTDASINAWKERFPLLYKGGQYITNDLMNRQKGMMSSTVRASLNKSGLEAPKDSGSQAQESLELGLNPITLGNRTSQAVVRRIGMYPETTKDISGGTLASMLANANANQNAFTQFLGATNTAKSIAAGAQSAADTQALLGGVTGAAGIAANYATRYDPALNLGSYTQGNYYDQTTPGPSTSAPVAWQPPPTAASTGSSGLWSPNPSANATGGYYGNAFNFSGQALSDLFPSVPSSDQYQLNMGGSSF